MNSELVLEAVVQNYLKIFEKCYIQINELKTEIWKI